MILDTGHKLGRIWTSTVVVVGLIAVVPSGAVPGPRGVSRGLG